MVGDDYVISHLFVGVFTFLACLGASGSTSPRIWGVLSTSDESSCGVTRNNRMLEGDLYQVRPYHMSSVPAWVYTQIPSECQLEVDYGDRFISVDVAKWWCILSDARRVSVIVYKGCGHKRGDVLFQLNCSVSDITMMSFFSDSSCVTVYHYRGKIRIGYDFVLYIRAEREVLAFSAEGIAAAFVGCLVGIMILLKIACVLTGYEERVPNLRKLNCNSGRLSPLTDNQHGPKYDTSGDQDRITSDPQEEDRSSVTDLSPTVVQMLPSSPRPSSLHGYGGDYDLPGPRRFSLYRTSSIFRK